MSQDADLSLSFHLHAELLPNIRQVTLYISLPQDEKINNLQPEVSLTESRRAVTVSLPEPFQDAVETIKLPARVGEASRRVLRMGKLGGDIAQNNKTESERREFSFRMPIDADEVPFVPREEVIDDFVPWTAADMSSSTKLRCRKCGNMILNAPEFDNESGTRTGWVWKDLPSGNWAEMMDFWHCHKPDTHEDDKEPGGEAQNDLVKGYGAANQLVAIPGTVLVDVATFLVAQGDCKGLKKVQDESSKASSANTKRVNITCQQCDTLVGLEDPMADGWRLLKANLSANTQPAEGIETEEPTWTSHPTETVVAAQLLELIERESARRFAVHCGQKNGLLLWVFNPDLRYSNSGADHSTTAQRGMKVFFRDTPNVDDVINPEQGKASSLSLEELELPSSIFAAVSECLIRSSETLPSSARHFREWRVGLLNRFERPGRG
ncbi:hypothetical protein ASPWEDRAFT_113398 [Aspergillus wentii DTO 134E9]|uniref:Ubiquitin-conjugating enzyme E2-binding protein n=1 Tax=Aspergillus wentii DTO 134E9 TaxID=1073089 RepID=A0A1L9RGF9_ASPWE|nr:uncharacterized protein ASPWEDRAFT_113398 [Aspergillus wentii DTO 134E9]OJJ34029.1 hypothetical protein ASPWEDRAFT_113398 [Aspergillus wentii DTO 134E9]